MVLKRVFITLLFLSSFLVHGREGHRAFFTIVDNDTNVVVKAEFPWSITDALNHYRPELERSKSKEDFNDALKAYVDEKLIMIDTGGIHLMLGSIREVHLNSGTHGAHYEFIYPSQPISTIFNSILFDIHEDQENYHEVIANGESWKFRTTKDIPVGVKPVKPQKAGLNSPWPIAALILTVTLLVLILIRRGRRGQV